jgi:hypothetical protein
MYKIIDIDYSTNNWAKFKTQCFECLENGNDYLCKVKDEYLKISTIFDYEKSNTQE